ncbi:hypothetical protein [Paenibacillus alvei]|uniref:hypothetical protein n=1 Tax=Paenibacillus alvei TaxID=44250 RepID=UPI0018CFB09B|nr:hypothetical protein [Paenibacillus alvei]
MSDQGSTFPVFKHRKGCAGEKEQHCSFTTHPYPRAAASREQNFPDEPLSIAKISVMFVSTVSYVAPKVRIPAYDVRHCH